MRYFLPLFFLISLTIEAKVLTLKEALDLAAKNNAEVKSESYKAAIAETDLTLIKGETGLKINALAGVGPINGKKGSVLGYTNEDTWGAQWVASLEAKLPLYMWGREKNLNQAATLNAEINQLDTQKKIQEVRSKLKEAYWGWQFTSSLKDFVSETQNDLDDALKILAEKKAKKEDLLRLEVLKYQVQEKLVQIQKSAMLAKMGVLFYIGIPQSEAMTSQLENEREWIEIDERELKDFEYYLEIMKNSFPDLQKVSKGIRAKNELLANEKKSELPVFGALFKYDYAQTNQREAQRNPFVLDRYNHSDVSAGVGLTWDLDFGVKKSKQDKLILEIAELKAKEYYAEEGLTVLLHKAYMDVVEAHSRALALQKAYKTAKKWLTNIQTSVGLGLTPAKDIIDAYTTRALVYKDYYESLYNYHLAWARLSEACGQEVDPLLLN